MAPRLDLSTPKLFVTIIEEQSIAKAAEREHIAASTASKRISDLEEALCASLLHRNNKGIDPTPADRAFLEYAWTIIRDLAQLESELVDYSKGTRGHVSIFANELTIFSYLTEELSGFLVEYAMVRIEFEAEVTRPKGSCVRRQHQEPPSRAPIKSHWEEERRWIEQAEGADARFVAGWNPRGSKKARTDAANEARR